MNQLSIFSSFAIAANKKDLVSAYWLLIGVQDCRTSPFLFILIHKSVVPY